MGKPNLKVDTIKKLDEKDLKNINIKDTKNKIVESVKETVYGHNRVRIILIMMIKNESKIIERALESVEEFVDGIVICDTGSTDDTVSIVTKYFKTLKIPTKLYKHKWQNFGHNRSLSFTETVSFCKSLKWPLDKTYGLLLDADQELNIDDDLFDPQDLTESGYNLLLKTSYNIYHVPKLINLGKKWRCVGSTHEYWEDPEDEKGPKDIDEDEMYIDDIGDGGCKSDKYERDIKLLTEELKNPINESRTIYYLGQSYFDSDQHEEAIKWFEKRIEYTLNNKIVDDKNDNPEEVYQAYLKIALSKKALKKSDIVDTFMKCIELYPYMLEPIYYLMKYYMDLDKWAEAYEIGKLGLDIEMDDKFITEYQIYDYLYKDEMLLVCLENNKYGIGIKLGLSLLKERKFDREDKERIKDNYKLCLEYLYMNDLESDNNSEVETNTDEDNEVVDNEIFDNKKICVFMSDNRLLTNELENSDYHSLAAAINYEYCKKYNYTFIYYRPYLNDKDNIVLNNCIDPKTKLPRHAAWSKLLSTSLALELDYDYVVYIDSDCIFKDFNKSLEQFIKPHKKNDVIFLNNKPWEKKYPCSGFYVCKVCPNVKELLIDWYNFDFGKRINHYRWEQGAIRYLFKEPKYNIKVVDDWMFRNFDGQYLRHIGTDQKEIRIPYFKDFINVNNIDYSKNISEIKCIDYNTNKE